MLEQAANQAGVELTAAWAGTGPRAWPVLPGTHGGRHAVALPAAAVQERLGLRLRGDRHDGQRVRQLLRRLDALNDAGLAVAGCLGYELGLALEDVPLPAPRHQGPPDADLVAFDPAELLRLPLPEARPTIGLAALAAEAMRRPPAELERQRDPWLAAVAQALTRIEAGGFYQVNLSVRFRAPAARVAGLPLLPCLAGVLRAQPVPYAMVFDGQDQRLLSGSMERFLGVQGRRVTSRPIKGTAPRGHGEADQRARDGLLNSPKERAENTMIVDMVRNDLGRVCEPGSVAVVELLACEGYATLWHLESEVTGRLPQGRRAADLLAATLPPASVTGCPKIAAMSFIAAAEGRRRGAYCGALGLAMPGGRADWSVGIRQLAIIGDEAWISVGSGIVADSRPAAEWAETCLKAAGALAWLAQLERP